MTRRIVLFLSCLALAVFLGAGPQRVYAEATAENDGLADTQCNVSTNSTVKRCASAVNDLSLFNSARTALGNAAVPIDVHNRCRYVDNNSSAGSAFFIPFRSSEEWIDGFIAHPPSGVSLTHCALPTSLLSAYPDSLRIFPGPACGAPSPASYDIDLPYERTGNTRQEIKTFSCTSPGACNARGVCAPDISWTQTATATYKALDSDLFLDRTTTSSWLRESVVYSDPPSNPPPEFTDGVCGASNGVLENPPASLCTAGTASDLTQTGGLWSWSCTGSNGGTTATCQTLPIEIASGYAATFYVVGWDPDVAGDTKQEIPTFSRRNPYTGEYSCPPGTIDSNIAPLWWGKMGFADIHACTQDSAASPSFYTNAGNPLLRRPNRLTGDTSCPAGMTDRTILTSVIDGQGWYDVHSCTAEPVADASKVFSSFTPLPFTSQPAYKNPYTGEHACPSGMATVSSVITYDSSGWGSHVPSWGALYTCVPLAPGQCAWDGRRIYNNGDTWNQKREVTSSSELCGRLGLEVLSYFLPTVYLDGDYRCNNGAVNIIREGLTSGSFYDPEQKRFVWNPTSATLRSGAISFGICLDPDNPPSPHEDPNPAPPVSDG